MNLSTGEPVCQVLLLLRASDRTDRRFVVWNRKVPTEEERGEAAPTKASDITTSSCQRDEQRGQEHEVCHGGDHQCQGCQPAQREYAAKITKAKDDKARDEHQRGVENADACLVDGVDDGAFCIRPSTLGPTGFLFIVHQKAYGDVDGNTQRDAKDDDSGWL